MHPRCGALGLFLRLYIYSIVTTVDVKWTI